MKTKRLLPLAGLLILALSIKAFAMISVRTLNKTQAQELGITMKQRSNGDAGVKVWLEFKKEGFLEKLTYAEMYNGECGTCPAE
ncbi:MAG: hypothetical protein ACI9TH_002715 [Kiritimatiellia bacterium]|jgi:hypothetical protein